MTEPPARVLSAYPGAVARLHWQPLGNAGGFSGALLWRGRDADGNGFCLRAWPEGRMTGERLRLIHGLMHHARFDHGLAFVPALTRCKSGETWVETGGRCWEVCEWLPGRADFRDQPTDVRLASALKALARVHAAWLPARWTQGPCPAIGRRLQAVADWQGLLSSGWHPAWGSAGEPEAVRDASRQLWERIPALLARQAADLARWREADVPLQPCLCDIWHDHILYTGDEVTGVVDYGQVKVDCVAVDLARLLGTLVPDQPGRWVGALFVYRQSGRLFDGADELVMLLDRTGVVVGAMNWLRWLYREGRAFADWQAVATRMTELARRLSASAAHV